MAIWIQPFAAVSGQFVTRFEQLTGHQPYPWQVRLFQSLVAGHIPHNLGAPTGAGKTGFMMAPDRQVTETRRCQPASKGRSE